MEQIKHTISIFFISLALVLFWTYPPTAHASISDAVRAAIQGASSIVRMPFGGQIISTVVTDVTCESGIGPISIRPAGKYAGDNYLALTSGNKTAGNTPMVDSWILGFYMPSTPSCLLNEEDPYSVKPIKLYGVSGSISAPNI